MLLTKQKKRGRLHKCEAFLIATTLLVVKAKNIYIETNKMPKIKETELSPKTAIGSSAFWPKDKH